MLTEFKEAPITYAAGARPEGNAAYQVISADDFTTAQQVITRWSGYTASPLISLSGLAAEIDIAHIYYKHEGPRFGLGSFKALGGAYAVYRVLQRVISKAAGHEVSMADVSNSEFAAIAANTTVASATDGNHGRSVAWGAQRLGMPCRIYIHAEVSQERADAIAAYGAEVIRIDGNYDDSVDITRQEAEENGWFIVSDTSWEGYTQAPREVMAGYSVMTQEVIDALAQAPTHVFLQGGVGGLAASVAASLRQHWGDESPRVVVVEPDLAPCLLVSAKAGQATNFHIEEETLMAGLSCGEPSEIAWQILAEETSDFMTIPESVIAPSVRLLATSKLGDKAIEAGESAIAGLAGMICAATQPDLRAKLGLNEHSRVLLIGTEGVTDQASFDRMMADQ